MLHNNILNRLFYTILFFKHYTILTIQKAYQSFTDTSINQTT